MTVTPAHTVQWQTADGAQHTARWQSERGAKPPAHLQCVDDTLPADTAYRLASEGTGLIWQSDFHNGRALVQALARRADKQQARSWAKQLEKGLVFPQAFHQFRLAQAQRARLLGSVLVQVQPDYSITLGRAPQLQEMLTSLWGENTSGLPVLVSLRELQGIQSAWEWQRRGISIDALGNPPNNVIYPAYGVYSPIRGEYIDLVAQTGLPAAARAPGGLVLDIGTGTGVLAAVLAKRGCPQVVGVDNSPRAVACAQRNIEQLGLAKQVSIVEGDWFANQQADLVVCNPPWLPGKAASSLEASVYDPDSAMLKGFFAGLPQALKPGGQAWLIMSNLAEHLGLRQTGELETWIEQAGLKLVGQTQIKPRHAKAMDKTDPLFAARSKERTRLLQLSLP